jgi:hypothetical protein
MNNLYEAEKEILRIDLLEYCKRDTFAMVKIFDSINALI